MDNVIEITVSDKKTGNLIVHIFKNEEGVEYIGDKEYDVEFKTK